MKMSPAAQTALRYALNLGTHNQMWDLVEVLCRDGTTAEKADARSALLRMPMIGRKAIDGLVAWWDEPVCVSTWTGKGFAVTWERR
jgi:hypothetical protein